MYVRSNRSAVQKNHRARSRAISMSMPETLPAVRIGLETALRHADGR
jgi:hypothetical protein